MNIAPPSPATFAGGGNDSNGGSDRGGGGGNGGGGSGGDNLSSSGGGGSGSGNNGRGSGWAAVLEGAAALYRPNRFGVNLVMGEHQVAPPPVGPGAPGAVKAARQSSGGASSFKGTGTRIGGSSVPVRVRGLLSLLAAEEEGGGYRTRSR